MVRRPQPNIDSLHADNYVNDIDLLYCAIYYAKVNLFTLGGKLRTRVYDHREALADGQTLRWRLNLSHMTNLMVCIMSFILLYLTQILCS